MGEPMGSAHVAEEGRDAQAIVTELRPSARTSAAQYRIRSEIRLDRPQPARAHAITDHRLILNAKRANGPVKRVLEALAAGLGLLALSPALLLVAAIISLQDGGSPLYGHKRVGRHNRTFTCWKFRSMARNGDEILKAHLAANPEAAQEWAATRKLRDDPRVTAFGRFIRRTSIDELPQLFNVLVGDMSLIGPRPVTRDELPRYGKDRRYYLLVRPGITGLWQVSGRSETTYARRVQLDRDYVENWSHSRDVSILLRTIPAVLKSDGAM